MKVQDTISTTIRWGFLLFVVVMLFWPLAAHGQVEVKLTASDGTTGDRFGRSVSVSEDVALVGAPFQADEAGAAYLFERIDGIWQEATKLTAAEAARDRFGWAVSTSGPYAFVGATLSDDQGAVYVFERVDGAWQEAAKLTASDIAMFDSFGWSVSVTEDIALVGAPFRGEEVGAAYLFERIDGAWQEAAELTASDGEAFDFFGFSTSVGGDVAVVGALEDDDQGENAGAAYVFERVDDAWQEAAKLTASDAAEGDNFGLSVSVSEGHVLVGAPGHGAVYLFERVDGTWQERATLTTSETIGTSVSVNGDRALVGASGSDDQGENAGAAYVFERVDDAWQETMKLTASDAAQEDMFGTSVSLTGPHSFVGAPLGDSGEDDAGAAYLFDLNRAPAPPSITSPEDGATMVIGGDAGGDPLDPETPFTVTWNESTDPDGDTVSYRWQLAAGDDFGEVLLSQETGTAIQFETTLGAVAAVLDGAGLELEASITLYHRVVANDGQAETVGAAAQVTLVRGTLVGTEDVIGVSRVYTLRPSYPNPFNPQTTIRYALPQAEHVRLAVYNALGREVAVLVDRRQGTGRHEVVFDAGGLSSGVYVYRLTAGSFTETRRMLLVK